MSHRDMPPTDFRTFFTRAFDDERPPYDYPSRLAHLMLERMRQLYLLYPQMAEHISSPAVSISSSAVTKSPPALPPSVLLIDLKVRPFKHGDAGQMNFYLNYWKEKMMAPGDEPPVGLILCTDKNQTRVSYTAAGLDQEFFVSRYLVALPKPGDLQALIERDTAAWLQNQPSEA